MGIIFTGTMRKAWDYLVISGMTQAGAAGMMGNMYSESGIIANRVEILCLKRLKEAGKSYDDQTYTAAVDSGAISRSEFLNPLPGRRYGYGLCQWTSPGRKGGLYDLCKKKGVSIGNLDAQLEYLASELKSAYSGVWKTLTTSDDIAACSDAVLLKFEVPGDTGTSVRQTRQGYSRELYDFFAEEEKPKEAAMKEDPIKKVIGIATAEIGYLEKASNSQLDSKTGNAGSNNYTKYWRDVYPPYQGQAWCACFVSWCFMKAFGLEAAKKMLKHWPYVYCPTLAGMTTNKKPKVGCIIIFYRSGTYTHTGLVIEVSGNKIITIEGNTSGASGIIANGGGVCRKTYDINTLSGNTKYFVPDYSLASGPAAGSATTQKPAQTSGTAVKEKTATQYADNLDKALAGTYQTTADLHIRNGAGTKYTSLGTLPKGTKVQNYGYYSTVNGTKWLYVQVTLNEVKYTGFSSKNYLKKV